MRPKPILAGLILVAGSRHYAVEIIGREPGDGALRVIHLMAPGIGTLEIAQVYGGAILIDGRPDDDAPEVAALIAVGLLDPPPSSSWDGWTDAVSFGVPAEEGGAR